MKRIKRAVALLLAFTCVFFYAPVETFAEDTNVSESQVENPDDVDARVDDTGAADEKKQSTEIPQQEVTEEVQEQEARQESEVVQGAFASVDYIYVEQPEVMSNTEENIVIGFNETDMEVDGAVLTYESNGIEKTANLANGTPGAVLFQLNESDIGDYVLKYIDVVKGETNQQIDLQTGQAASFSVVEGTPAGEETNITIAAETGETISVANLQDALEQVVEEKEENNTDSLLRSSRRADNGNFVVVLDPGHDNTHAGARNYSTGIMEEQYTLAIAQACRNALSGQKGVEVYMVRADSGVCPFPGTTSVQCNTKRAEFAQSVNADVYISIHLNSSDASAATGAEVYVAENGKFADQTTELSEKILDKLSALGLKDRGVKAGDDLNVIRNCLAKDIPAILIEHGFIGNSHDASIIKNQTTQLGQTDAKSILEYYQKEIANPQPTAFTIDPRSSAKSGEDVTLTVHPKGVEEGYSQYHFIAYSVKTDTWSDLTSYSDKTSYKWQPKESGDYILGMEAKNPATGAVKQHIIWSYFNVAEQVINVDDIRTSVGKNGLEITLNAVVNPAISGAKYYYQVYDLSAGKWIDVAPKSNKKEVVWKPEKSGDYWIHVYVETTSGSVYEKNIAYTVSGGAVYSSDLQVDQNADKSFSLTGKYEAFSGEAVSGMFLAYDGTQWKVIKDWYDVSSSRTQTVTWYPSEKGNYLLCFQTSTSSGLVSQKMVSQSVETIPSKNIVVKQIKTSKASPQAAGTAIELEAVVDGEISPNLTCIYMCYDGEGWRWIHGSNKLEKATWIPDKPGNYLVNYQVNDEMGKVAEKYISYTITEGNVVKVKKLNTSLPSPQSVGSEIELQPVVEGNVTSDLNCVYMYYDGEKWNWIYGSNKVEAVVWKPEKAGNYTVNYQINRGNVKLSEEYINFTVTEEKKLGVTDFIVNKASPQAAGTSIMLNAKIEGAVKNNYKYTYMVYDGTKWTLIKESDDLESAVWTPIKSGNYLLNFQVNSSIGKIAEKYLNYSVSVPEYGINIQGISLNRNSPQTIGARIVMEGQATTKYSCGLTYRYLLYDCSKGSWGLLGESLSPQPCVWRPTQIGDYWICYQITTPEGKDTSYIETYKVEPGFEISGIAGTTVDQMVKYFVKYNPNYDQFNKYADGAYDGIMEKGGAGDIRTFCQIYYEEAIAEGIKPEVAFAQAMLETGFLKFGGLVKPDQYNFAGLGATGAGVSGAAFKDVREGVRAQIQHLKCYSNKSTLMNPCVDPRWNEMLRGKAPYVEWLGIPNNPYDTGWAADEWYGDNIKSAIKVLKNM